MEQMTQTPLKPLFSFTFSSNVGFGGKKGAKSAKGAWIRHCDTVKERQTCRLGRHKEDKFDYLTTKTVTPLASNWNLGIFVLQI
ncbi:MAG: hypothetical protein AB8H86_16425 [Polyangiales bacterium]